MPVETDLREQAVEHIQRVRRFKVHVATFAVLAILLGISWMLTEYYTHDHHMWPHAFADAPAERPGVWSTWYFYALAVGVVLLLIDAYKTFARPYVDRRPTEDEIDREVRKLAHR